MVALTAARKTTDEVPGVSRALPVKANATIYQGALVCAQGGVVVPGQVANDLVALGRAEHGAKGGASDGDVNVTVKRGVFHFANDGAAPVTLNHLGQDCYVLDDQTVSSSHDTNARSVAGTVFDVDAKGVWVEFK